MTVAAAAVRLPFALTRWMVALVALTPTTGSLTVAMGPTALAKPVAPANGARSSASLKFGSAIRGNSSSAAPNVS